MRIQILRLAAGEDLVREIDVYDDEANPLSLTGYSGRIRVDALDGASVVDSTASPRVIVSSKGRITYRALPADLLPGTYRYLIEYTDATGVVHAPESGQIYVDGAP